MKPKKVGVISVYQYLHFFDDEKYQISIDFERRWIHVWRYESSVWCGLDITIVGKTAEKILYEAGSLSFKVVGIKFPQACKALVYWELFE